ncbi:cupredoxin family copper-binding protein [Pseudonocardia sp. H11422]|uniref:cupredoxin domain-containing protein n=1 Tax=Pseudonocardia sp. H11422 TaxID=2835866 RepID=UPI0027E25AA4|nr:cupredoxin family copper-binding protein [Pseudonocardia sp. H11422]
MEPFGRKYLGTLSAVVALAALTGCGAPTSDPAAAPRPDHRMSMPVAAVEVPVRPVATVTVSIANFAFSPAAVQVKAGTTVTWTNNDSAPHDVRGGPLRSPTLNRGAGWSYTFTTPGSYRYICSIHPSMTGAVTVTA